MRPSGRLSNASGRTLIVNSPLRQNSFGVRMLDFAHFGDEVGSFDEFGVRVTSGTNYMDAFGTRDERFDHAIRVEHLVADHVINFVEDDQIVFVTVNLLT